MRHALPWVLSLPLLFAGPPVHARDTVDSLVAEAGVLAREGKHAEAAGAFGDAAALAHKAGDVLEEQKVATALDVWVDGLKGKPELRPSLVVVMQRLDPKRLGATVSAAPLARSLLLLATEAGDTAHAAEALEVLEGALKNRKGGVAAVTSVLHARGVKAIADGNDREASEHLGRALAEAVENRWSYWSVSLVTELAAVCVRLEDPPGAAAAMKTVVPLLDGDVGTEVLKAWMNLVNRRLAEAPIEARVPYDDLVKARFGEGDNAVGVPGTPGAPGGDGGAGSIRSSPAGDAWPRIPKARAVVTVRRGEEGFEVREAWKPKGGETHSVTARVSHHSHGGVFLRFQEHSVNLVFVDLGGRQGLPGDGWQSNPAWAWYPLAHGETWSFAKDGQVTIER